MDRCRRKYKTIYQYIHIYIIEAHLLMQIELNHSQWHHVVEFTNELLQTIPQRIELTILQYQLNQRFTVLQALRARAFHTKYIKVMSARC